MFVKGILAAIFSAFCYATLAVLGKIGLNMGLDAVDMLQYRFTFAALSMFVFFMLTRPSKLKGDIKLIGKGAALGLLFYLPQSFFFFSSLKYVPASVASLILYFYPLVVLILTIFVVKEPLSREKSASVAVILAGCMLVFYDAFFLKSISLTGIGLAFCACFTFSSYLVATQVFIKTTRPVTMTFYVLTFAAIGYFAVNGTEAFYGMDGKQLAFAVTLGIVPTALAVGFLYVSIGLIGAAYASIFSSFEPAVTVLMAMWLLDESVNSLQVGGMVLIILGMSIPKMIVRHRAAKSAL